MVDDDLLADLDRQHLVEDIDAQTTRCLCGWVVTGGFWTRAMAQDEHLTDVKIARYGFEALAVNDQDGPVWIDDRPL